MEMESEFEILKSSPKLMLHILECEDNDCIILDYLYSSSIEGKCIVYRAQKNRPNVQRNGRKLSLAKAIFIHLNGEPKYWVLHTCDIQYCWTPEHLYDGSRQDNYRDLYYNGKNVKYYSPEDKLEALSLLERGYTLQQVSEEIGASMTTIHRWRYNRR